MDYGPFSHVNSPSYGNSIRIYSDTNSEGIGDGPPNVSDSSDTISSSLSDSSSDELFLVNPRILASSNARNNIPKPVRGTKPPYKSDHVDISNEALFRLEESIESPESTPRFSNITHESLIATLSPTQSPPIQMMERSRGFDPNRIPISIFSGSSTPMEWSVASNESLFSIHIGNNSFSKEQGLRMSMELPKSKEVSAEPNRSSDYNQHDIVGYKESEGLYQLEERKSLDNLIWSKQTLPTDEGEVPNSNERFISIAQPHINNKPPANFGKPRDYAIVTQSEKNVTVVKISAFPKKKKSSWPGCHCSDCCHTIYCCKWSSCSCTRLGCCFKWPSCSCKWLSCSGCCSCKWFICSSNCLSWRGCCSCKFPNGCCKCPSCCHWKLKWPSCRFKCPSCPSCNCNCLKWSRCCSPCPSWRSCKCPSWPSCKCHSSSCAWTCCSCWKSKPKKLGSSCISKKAGDQHTMPPSSIQASSKRRYSCFSCSSSCSCC